MEGRLGLVRDPVFGSSAPPWQGADTRRLLAMMIAALVLFAYGLGVGTLWDQDEAKYTQVAVELLRTRDPFTLVFNGEPWFVHPPLYMWLQAATGWLFGFTEFTARIWSAISGAAVVGVTFLLGRFLYDSRTGLLASVVLATTIQVVVQSRLAVFDPTLLAFMLAAFYMFLVAGASGSRRASLWAWAWAGLATATKGPIGLLLPAMVITAVALVRGRFARPTRRDLPLLGLALFVVIGLHWYVIETVRHGLPFVRTVVGQYLLGRFFGVVDNQAGPWWYYGPVLLVGAFPWTGFLLPALVYHLWRRREFASQVILLWIGITLAFYTAAATKLPNYVLPVYPFLAIAVGRLCVAGLDGRSADVQRLLRWAFALMPTGTAVLVAALAVLGSIRHPAELTPLRTPLLIIAGVFAAGPLAALALYLWRRPGLALATLAATIAAVLPVLIHHTLPAIEAHRPLPRIAERLRQHLRPDDGLAVLMPETASLVYYTQHQVIWVEDPVELDRAVCRYDRLFVVVPDHKYQTWVASRLPAAARQQGAEGPYRILLKDGATPCAGALPDR